MHEGFYKASSRPCLLWSTHIEGWGGFVFCQSASGSQATVTVTQSLCSHAILHSSCTDLVHDAVTNCCKATSTSTYITHLDPGAVLKAWLKPCFAKCADSQKSPSSVYTIPFNINQLPCFCAGSLTKTMFCKMCRFVIEPWFSTPHRSTSISCPVSVLEE